MMLSERSVLSAREAAAVCGVDERSVRRWIASGRLPADRGRSGYRIARAALAPFLEVPADAADGPAAAVRTDRTDGADPSDIADTAPLSAVDNSAAAEVAWLRAEVERLHERLREAHLLVAQ